MTGSYNFFVGTEVKCILVGGWTNPFEKYATVKLDHFPNFAGWKWNIFETTIQYLVIQSDLFGMVKRDPFKWLSDPPTGE